MKHNNNAAIQAELPPQQDQMRTDLSRRRHNQHGNWGKNRKQLTAQTQLDGLFQNISKVYVNFKSNTWNSDMPVTDCKLKTFKHLKNE